MDTQKLVKLIDELAQYDHCFLSPEGVKHFTEPFGFKCETYKAKDTSFTHKGLSLKDKTKNEGQDADVVACEIASHLGIDYTSYFGRGSQLAGACAEIKQHLLKEKVTA